MITRTFNNGRYLYNFNNQGDRYLESLIHLKAKDFNDEDAIQCIGFIADEIALYKTYFMQMKTFSLFNELFRETCTKVNQTTSNAIMDAEHTEADKIADYIAFILNK